MKILIDLLPPFVGVLSDRYCELTWHRPTKEKSLNPFGLRLYDSKSHHATRFRAVARLGAVRTCVA